MSFLLLGEISTGGPELCMMDDEDEDDERDFSIFMEKWLLIKPSLSAVDDATAIIILL